MMNRSLLRGLSVLLLAFAAACGGDSPSGPGDGTPNVRGNYNYSATTLGITITGTVAITQQNGGAFSGTYFENGSSSALSGSINGTSVTFAISGPAGPVNHTGNYSDGNVAGNYVVSLFGSTATSQGTFTLTRTP
jgi:hypothetical protein